MNYPEKLLLHASSLLVGEHEWKEADLRRAVSASYYALFHQINEDAAGLLAPNVSTETSNRIQRWIGHSTMKEICGRFIKPRFDQPLLGLVGDSASSDMQFVCGNLITLQNRRHDADYDLSSAIDFDQAMIHVFAAEDAIDAWKRIRNTAEANIFILSLVLWRNWEKER